jgi:hypothetical protein
MSKEKQTFSNKISRFVIVISALAFGIKLMAQGLMSVEKMVLFLLIITIAAAIDSAWVKLIMALFALGFVLVDVVGPDFTQIQNLIFNVFALLIVLFGLFVTFGGLRPRK